MPSPYGRAITAAVFVFAVTLIPASRVLAVAATTGAPPDVSVPIGVSLSTHIPLNANLVPENSIIPQASTTTSQSIATSSTTTKSSIGTLIQSLYVQVQALEAQIAALEATSATTTTNSTSTGNDVSSLQEFLRSQGYYTYPSITGYFGSVTEAAVEAFQNANGVEAVGEVGPFTRAKIAATSAACARPANTAQTTPTSSATSTTTITPGLIAPIIGGYGGGGGGGSGGGGGGAGGGSTPDTTPPTEPTNLVATPASASEINLSWSASTGNGQDAIEDYKVFRNGAQIATSSTNSYADTGLSPSTLYSYWVAAYDTANNISTSTNGVSAETEAGPDQYGTTWHDLKIGAGGY